MSTLTPRDRLIVALDFPSAAQALDQVDQLDGQCLWLKVGLELFLAAGSSIVTSLRERGFNVFLDLKLHDIPETVDRAVGRASSLGARMLTVHASGGPAMLRRATERAAKEGAGLQIVAVTVLTSLDWGDLAAIGMEGGVAGSVERLARMAWAEGVRAFVCSPHEAAALRAALGPEATLVTPGVRASGGGDDQKRTMSAREAIHAGASWVVVGRPIRDAADPLAAARAIASEVDQARGGSGG